MRHDVEHDEILLQESQLEPEESLELRVLLLRHAHRRAGLALELPLLSTLGYLLTRHEALHRVRNPVPLAGALAIRIRLQLLRLLP